MKKIFLVLFVLFYCSSYSKSQTVKREWSNAEVFSVKPEAFIETQFIQIGYVDLIELRVMKIKDINSGTTISAVRFEYQTTNQLFSQTKLAVIDADELDGLISALNMLLTKIFASNKDAYTEVTFQTRSGFVTGGYYTPEKKKWTPYIQLDRQDNKSTISIAKEDFSHFLDLLKQAKEKM
jgi:hypothetical protein